MTSPTRRAGSSPATRTTRPASRPVGLEPDRTTPTTRARGGVTPVVLRQALRATEAALTARVAVRADAVELMRVAHETAWKQIQERAPEASARDRADAAFAVASMSILRPEEIGKLRMVDSGQTRVVAFMEAAARGRDPDRSFVAVDRTVGKGALDPRFADGTDNQVFHTGFFVAAGYVSAGRVDQKAKTYLAAFVHETPLDPGVTSGKYSGMPSGGASQEDLRASLAGAMVGERLRELRDAGKGHLAGTIVAGVLARSVDLVPARLPAEQHAEAVREILALRRQQQRLSPVVDSPAVKAIVGPGPSPVLSLIKAWRRSFEAAQASEQ
ncbi:MAG: hypothetical protein VKP72_09450 [bacterium]|nr:hypothetical protein [bacterium]